MSALLETKRADWRIEIKKMGPRGKVRSTRSLSLLDHRSTSVDEMKKFISELLRKYLK